MTSRKLNATVKCGDGFTMSVQANDGAYCSPRIDNAIAYSSVEIGYPSEKEMLIMRYADSPNNPTDTVYGYVPAEIIVELIRKHGGMSDGAIPPLDLTPRNS